MILAFSSLDILSFFIFFEAVLIPMFFLVTLWGVRVRRIRAVFMLILYTLFGSVCLLIAIFLIYCELGTTSFFILFMTPLTLYKQKIF